MRYGRILRESKDREQSRAYIGTAWNTTPAGRIVRPLRPHRQTAACLSCRRIYPQTKGWETYETLQRTGAAGSEPARRPVWGGICETPSRATATNLCRFLRFKRTERKDMDTLRTHWRQLAHCHTRSPPVSCPRLSAGGDMLPAHASFRHHTEGTGPDAKLSHDRGWTTLL